MIQKSKFKIPFLKRRNIGILLFLLLLSCNLEEITPGDPRFNIIEKDEENVENNGNDENTENMNQASGDINAVYFAQTHVFEPNYMVPNTSNTFKLISERDVLIKVHVLSDKQDQLAPEVKAILKNENGQREITLSGPEILPTSFNSKVGEVQHNFNDSFTGIIPKEMVKPGLQISIIAGNDEQTFDNLEIGAPNRIYMTNFEINAFIPQSSNFKNGWEEEFENNVPTAELSVQYIPDILFSEITVPPSGVRKAARVSSKAEYTTLTGGTFNQHNTTATQWNNALRNAAGTSYRNLKYVTVSYSYNDGENKGVAGGFSGVQRRSSGSTGLFLHEFGHGLSLPHWGDNNNYPYKGNIHGILGGSVYNETHSGPTWSYNAANKTFIKPTIDGVSPLTYKNDPMQGGGERSPEPGFLLNHFSDYSVNQMRNYMENHIVVYKNGQYSKWDNGTNDYTKTQINTGNVKFPIQRDANVISVIAGGSSKTAQANIIYPPIGPYTSGLIDVFDPRDTQDRANADTFFCPNGGCDTTLKIIQGGNTKYIMLAMELDSSLSESDSASFVTKAVNLPAADGTVTAVELLSTPNAEINGLPNNPTVMYRWEE